MNKASLRLSILLAVSFVVFFSCKKTNKLNPTPANSRLLNVTRRGIVSSPLGVATDTVDENYRFLYDNYGRVSKIYYTTNDITKTNTISNLSYQGDTIIDRITFVTNVLIEQDTFITDLHGHITRTYIQGAVTNYYYYGDLLTRIVANDGTYEELTSYNGNFIAARSSLGPAHNSNFAYYTDQHNRIGDYFYLTSMFRFGHNLYQNSSLIKTIDVPGSTTNAFYVIDGDSKITQTTAVVSDTSGAYRNDVYDIQYEKY